MSPVTVNNILFLDIETVSQYPSYDKLPDNWRQLWDTKSVSLAKYHEGSTNESLYPRAAIYAEFGKIICISCGVLQGTAKDRRILLKSFYGDDEALLLRQFSEMLNKWCAGEPKYLCAHNGKEFDFPYLSRRMIINKLALPSILSNQGKKPWEVCHLDTLELWKFGDFKNYTSLNLLAHTLGIATPKDDLDGSMVGQVYWESPDQDRRASLERIATYCQKDVVAVAQVYLRICGEEIVCTDNIEIKP